MKMARYSGQGVVCASGLLVEIYGEVGSPIKNSRFFRDYCYMPGCNEPIRVPRDNLGYPNVCSFCQPAYRGSPGVTEAERLFWIRETWELVEILSA